MASKYEISRKTFDEVCKHIAQGKTHIFVISTSDTLNAAECMQFGEEFPSCRLAYHRTTPCFSVSGISRRIDAKNTVVVLFGPHCHRHMTIKEDTLCVQGREEDRMTVVRGTRYCETNRRKITEIQKGLRDLHMQSKIAFGHEYEELLGGFSCYDELDTDVIISEDACIERYCLLSGRLCLSVDEIETDGLAAQISEWRQDIEKCQLLAQMRARGRVEKVLQAQTIGVVFTRENAHVQPVVASLQKLGKTVYLIGTKQATDIKMANHCIRAFIVFCCPFAEAPILHSERQCAATYDEYRWMLASHEDMLTCADMLPLQPRAAGDIVAIRANARSTIYKKKPTIAEHKSTSLVIEDGLSGTPDKYTNSSPTER